MSLNYGSSFEEFDRADAPEETDDFIRLPASMREPRRATLQSSDVEVVTCEHELARALEQYLTSQPVQLFQADAEFQEAARQILALVHDPKCPIRGR